MPQHFQGLFSHFVQFCVDLFAGNNTYLSFG